MNKNSQLRKNFMLDGKQEERNFMLDGKQEEREEKEKKGEKKEKKKEEETVSIDLGEQFFKSQRNSKHILEVIPKDTRASTRCSPRFWTPVYPVSYEGRVIFKGHLIKAKKDNENRFNLANGELTEESEETKSQILDLVDLSERKATIITRYDQSKFTVSHSSLATLFAISLCIGIREGIDAIVSKDGVLITDKVIAFFILFISLVAAYYEKTRKSSMDSRRKDLQRICERIDERLCSLEESLALPSPPRL